MHPALKHRHPLDRWEIELRGDYQEIPYQPTMPLKPLLLALAVLGVLAGWGWW